MKKAGFGLILLNGEIPDGAAVKQLARRARAVICADGGARHAQALGLEPDFIAGDMDSLPKPLPRWRKAVFACDFDEDRSDFDKALDLALELGLRSVCVAGALGGVLDHSIVNLAVVAARAHELEIVVVDNGTARVYGPGKHPLPLTKGRRFSLLALPPAARVSLSGARYALKKNSLAPGSRGLGNRSRGTVRLTVHAGRLWLMTEWS